ncbi:MAG: capsule biosynthesis protein CapA, partial [Paracoccaceae bacterium]
MSIRIHVFEEGYLRPYWLTYERDGSNGNSRLMGISLSEMKRALDNPGAQQPNAPARWGDLRQHMFYGALYHFLVMALNGGYRNFRPHRGLNVRQEFRLQLRRLLLLPLHRLERRIANHRVKAGGFPYHLVLLQLEHDASFLSHSGLPSMAAFVELCLDAFARGAPPHYQLVFKAHPLEDDRAPLRQLIRKGAKARGLQGRVHFVRGGKLADLLRTARSAVTVNSTSAQQALWRGIPVRALGRAIYSKPELVSDQPLAEFFARPAAANLADYRDFRQFLLETSQIPGGYYSARGRRNALRVLVDRMLDPQDPYDALIHKTEARQQHFRLVK